jgi:hypothetical protein
MVTPERTVLLAADHHVAARVVIRPGRQGLLPEPPADDVGDGLERVGGHEIGAVVAERDRDVGPDGAESPDRQAREVRLEDARAAVAVRTDGPAPAQDLAREVKPGEIVEQGPGLDHGALDG